MLANGTPTQVVALAVNVVSHNIPKMARLALVHAVQIEEAVAAKYPRTIAMTYNGPTKKA